MNLSRLKLQVLLLIETLFIIYSYLCCEGSDLDGDCYFICWDKRFIPDKQKKAFNYDEDETKVPVPVPRKEYELKK